MAMRVKFRNSYKKAAPGGGVNDVFVYKVSGSDEELAKYRETQGDNYRSDDETKEALFFTTRCAPNGAELIITPKGRVVVDMSEFDQANSLAKQYGGNLGQEMAREAAQRLMSFNRSTARTAPVADPSLAGGGTGNGDLGDK